MKLSNTLLPGIGSRMDKISKDPYNIYIADQEKVNSSPIRIQGVRTLPEFGYITKGLNKDQLFTFVERYHGKYVDYNLKILAEDSRGKSKYLAETDKPDDITKLFLMFVRKLDWSEGIIEGREL